MIFFAVMVVAANAQQYANPGYASNGPVSPEKPGNQTTTFDWNSIVSTEARLARYDLEITKPSNSSSLLGKLIGEFRSIQLHAFQRSDSEPMVISGVALEARQNDYTDPLNFRLGPWFEGLLTEKILLHASGGLALGLLDAGAGWSGTPLMTGTSFRSRNEGNYFEVMRGFSAGVDAVYHFSRKWGVGVGAQFQNLGFSDRTVNDRPPSLDWSKCILVQAGVSYSF